jgi:hypothetical protein
MRRLVRILGVLGIILLPSAVFAQASLTGVARDTSGAVLPGVTVEAASPVLIEKVRSTVTDGNGRYQLVDLRPGSYTVTFTLTGFNTVRREMVTLSGAGTVQVDGEMRVGALEETITVTGEAAVVDVQSTTRQSVLSAETIDSLPTSRNYVALARLIPGTQGGGNDVGGSALQDVGGSVTIHGSKSTDQRVTLNGINTMTLQAGGNIGGQIPDLGSAAEVTVDTSSLGADLPTGGVRINFVPRDGGNTFSNSTFFTFANQSLQGNNFSDELRAQGLAAPNAIDYNYDVNQSIGGPMKRDKVWFWMSVRYNKVSNYAAVFENANAFNPNAWTYVPTTVQGRPQGKSLNSSIRVTYQITPKHKLAGTYKVDRWCNCPNGVSATTAPEAGTDRRFPRLRQEHIEWTSPLTSRLLAEFVGMHLFERWGNMHLRHSGGSLDTPEQEAAMRQMISVNDQALSLTYRAAATYNNTEVPNFAYRGAVSYITGTHAIKAGFNRVHGYLHAYNYSLQPVNYRFNNGIPNQITVRALPHTVKSNQDNDLGLYVQDRVSLNRLTVNLALRYDMFQTSYPEQTLGPTILTPTRNATFPAQDHLDWQDLTYRTGFSYDLFGNGKTAVKAAMNKYLLGQTLNGIAGSGNPINTLVTNTTRTWGDADGDFVPDCDLVAPGANGECGGLSNTNFGTVITSGTSFDPNLITGWGNRPSNWEFTASVQHEILPRVSLDVGWFRRVWQNFQVTDNLAVNASDFDTFDVRAPLDSRLPGGGGQLLTGLRTLKAASFGRPDVNYNTLDSTFGEQTDQWNGVDVTVNGRLANGLTFQFGTSTGRQATDNCEIRAALPELSLTSPTSRCLNVEPYRTDIKGYATYVVPVVDVQLSGTYRRTQGQQIQASFTMNNAYLAANSTLGRPLAGGATANISVDLLEPNTLYGPARNELDLRLGKVLRFGRMRSVVSLDIFNAMNNNAILGYNDTITANQTQFWPRPTSILNARLMKVSVNLDF